MTIQITPERLGRIQEKAEEIIDVLLKANAITTCLLVEEVWHREYTLKAREMIAALLRYIDDPDMRPSKLNLEEFFGNAERQ